MSTLEQTVRCPICGEPYKFYPFYAGDQSACPDCVQRAEERIRRNRERRTGFPVRFGEWTR